MHACMHACMHLTHACPHAHGLSVWCVLQIETPHAIEFSKEEKMRMLDRLTWSDHFEAFLANKYSTAKRFGLEGCESLIVGMKELIDTSTSVLSLSRPT